MSIADNVTREQYSHRGGGVEIDLTEYGYEGEFMSAYQNYLGGGMLGSIANDSTIKGWESDPALFEIARQLREYYYEQTQPDEYNQDTSGRPVSYPGL